MGFKEEVTNVYTTIWANIGIAGNAIERDAATIRKGLPA